MAIHHLARQTELDAELAHFVLEQLAQRLQQLEVHLLGQAADVVVALDHMRLARARAGRFDHVGIDRALRQPANPFELAGLFLEHLDEQAADDLALAFGVALALQRAEEALFRIDTNHPHTHVPGERLHHLVAFVLPQQTVIDEHARELLAQGSMQQCCDHRGIDAARQAEQHAIGPDLLAHARD